MSYIFCNILFCCSRFPTMFCVSDILFRVFCWDIQTLATIPEPPLPICQILFLVTYLYIAVAPLDLLIRYFTLLSNPLLFLLKYWHNLINNSFTFLWNNLELDFSFTELNCTLLTRKLLYQFYKLSSGWVNATVSSRLCKIQIPPQVSQSCLVRILHLLLEE